MATTGYIQGTYVASQETGLETLFISPSLYMTGTVSCVPTATGGLQPPLTAVSSLKEPQGMGPVQ